MTDLRREERRHTLIARALRRTASYEEAMIAAELALLDESDGELGMDAHFSFDIFHRQAQGILNRVLRSGRAIARAARRELQAILSGSRAGSAWPKIVQFVEKYRVLFGRLLSVTQLASLLEGATEVARQVPTLPSSVAGTPPPPSLPPQRTQELLRELRPLSALRQAEALYRLPVNEQLYLRDLLRVSEILPDLGLLAPPQGSPEETVFPAIQEGARLLASKNLMTRRQFDLLSDAVRQKAFTVAGVESTETLGKIRDVLAQQVGEGADYKDFTEKVMEAVGEGTFLSDGHRETVFRANVQGGFSDGQMQLLQHPMIRRSFPYAAYSAIHDDRVRHNHLELEKLGIQQTNVYRIDDPVFTTFRPPWDFNDRCGWTPLTVEDAAGRGVREAQEWLRTGREPETKAFVQMPPFRPPAGFQRPLEGMPLSVQMSMQPLPEGAFGYVRLNGQVGWAGRKPPGDPSGWTPAPSGPKKGMRWLRVANRQRSKPQQAQPKGQRQTPEQAASKLRAMLQGGVQPQHVQEAAQMLMGMTVRDIHEAKRQLGLKASGRKLELAQKVAERALNQAMQELGTPPPPAEAAVPAREPQAPPAQETPVQVQQQAHPIEPPVKDQPEIAPEATPELLKQEQVAKPDEAARQAELDKLLRQNVGLTWNAMGKHNREAAARAMKAAGHPPEKWARAWAELTGPQRRDALKANPDVKLTGPEIEQARKKVSVREVSRQHVEETPLPEELERQLAESPLTDQQRTLLRETLKGNSLRVVGKMAGFDHPQKVANALKAALKVYGGDKAALQKQIDDAAVDGYRRQVERVEQEVRKGSHMLDPTQTEVEYREEAEVRNTMRSELEEVRSAILSKRPAGNAPAETARHPQGEPGVGHGNPRPAPPTPGVGAVEPVAAPAARATPEPMKPPEPPKAAPIPAVSAQGVPRRLHELTLAEHRLPPRDAKPGAFANQEQIANQIHDAIKNNPKIPDEAVGKQSAEKWADKFVQSDGFVLAEIPIDKIDWRGSQGEATKYEGESRTKGPIIIDRNQGRGRLQGNYGAAPDSIVLDGQHRLHEARQRGDKTILAWVGNRVADKFGVAKQYASEKHKQGHETNRYTPYYFKGQERHREAVQAAIAAGEHVPPEVLADYPDLAPKMAPQAPPPAPVPARGPQTPLDELLGQSDDDLAKLMPQMREGKFGPGAQAAVVAWRKVSDNYRPQARMKVLRDLLRKHAK